MADINKDKHQPDPIGKRACLALQQISDLLKGILPGTVSFDRPRTSGGVSDWRSDSVYSAF